MVVRGRGVEVAVTQINNATQHDQCADHNEADVESAVPVVHPEQGEGAEDESEAERG